LAKIYNDLRPVGIVYLFLILLGSCGPKIVYEHKTEVPDPWKYSDTLSFEYEISDVSKAYDLMLRVSHNKDFRYENLYIRATTTFPDMTVTSSPLSLELSKDGGEWEGNCSSKTCTAEIMLSQQAFFKTKGRYRLKLEQFSRQDSLPGVSSMTLLLTEATQKK